MTLTFDLLTLNLVLQLHVTPAIVMFPYARDSQTNRRTGCNP